MKDNIQILKEERILDAYFKVDKATVSEKKDTLVATYERCKLTRPNAVAVLIYNEDSKTVTLVKQFRYPVHEHTTEDIFEVVAGKIDGDENPKSAAVREVDEEVGYKITEEMLSSPIEMFASPGYSTEKIYIFLAVVKNSDKIEGAGGGLETENESIEIVEMDLNEFIKQVRNNEIKDAKTIIAANLIKI